MSFLTPHITTETTTITLIIIGHTPRCGLIAIDTATIGGTIIATTGETIAVRIGGMIAVTTGKVTIAVIGGIVNVQKSGAITPPTGTTTLAKIIKAMSPLTGESLNPLQAKAGGSENFPQLFSFITQTPKK
jgi:hypothetical protein